MPKAHSKGQAVCHTNGLAFVLYLTVHMDACVRMCMCTCVCVCVLVCVHAYNCVSGICVLICMLKGLDKKSLIVELLAPEMPVGQSGVLRVCVFVRVCMHAFVPSCVCVHARVYVHTNL